MRLRERLPTHLTREPLLEALWELRYTSEHPASTELLTAAAFKAFGQSLSSSERLITANIPRELRDADQNLRYAPTIRLIGQPIVVSISERSVALSWPRPYESWRALRARIIQLLDAVYETGAIRTVESFSIKYIDCIGDPAQGNLGALDVRVDVAGLQLRGEPVWLRTEFRELGFTHIVSLSSPAEAKLKSGEMVRGIVVDVDTHCAVSVETGDSKQFVLDQLDAVHTANKAVFFSLLTDDTIGQLGAEYAEKGQGT